MARYTFGATTADVVFRTVGGNLFFAAGLTCTLWSAATAGTQYTDLLNAGGGATTTVTTLADGSLPSFSGPSGVVDMWLDFGGAERVLVQTRPSAAYVGATIVQGAGIDPTGATDSAAGVQAFITALPATGGWLHLPAGTYKFLSTLTSANKPLKITGDGPTRTIFKFTACNGMAVTNNAATFKGVPVIIRDVAFLTTTAGTYTAFSYTGPGTVHYGEQILITGCEFNGDPAGGFWNTNINATNAYQVNIRDFTISGQDAAAGLRSTYGVILTGTKDVKITQGSISYCENGVTVSTGSEGVVINHNHIVACVNGVTMPTGGGNYVDVSHNHLACSSVAIDTGQANNCQINNNFFLLYDAMADHLPTNYYGIKVHSSYNVVSGNSLLQTTGSNLGIGIEINVGTGTPTNSANNIIANNMFNNHNLGLVIQATVSSTVAVNNAGVGIVDANIVSDGGTASRITTVKGGSFSFSHPVVGASTGTFTALTLTSSTLTGSATAGGAAALPATPSQYLTMVVNGTTFKLPLYL